MSKHRQDDGENERGAEKAGLTLKRGFPLYETNPSITNDMPTRIRTGKMSRVGDAYMVAPGTGQVVANGAFGFVEEKEIDTEEFVKIYLAGIRQYGELTKAGALLFEYVYHEMSGVEAKDKDTVAINAYYIKKWKPDITVRTYNRGLHELLAKEFLFRSPTTDVFFVNVRFMFNGDRLVLVQSYRRKAKKTAPRQLQNELPLDEEE